MAHTQRSRSLPRVRSAFTLIELLVVISIIALLIGILLPALGSARNAGRDLVSLTNIRSLSQAMALYATGNDDKFPPNVPPTEVFDDGLNGLRWFDEIILGEYIPQTDSDDIDPNDGNNGRATIGGGVMRDPNHQDGGRSYSMNYWASSFVTGIRSSFTGPARWVRPDAKDSFGTYVSSGTNELLGKSFDASVDFASNIALVTGGWGQWGKDGSNNTDNRTSDGQFKWYTQETVGRYGLPGERWGGNSTTPLDLNFGNWSTGSTAFPSPELDDISVLPTSYIPYYRHPKRSGDLLEIKGVAQIGFADGSVRPIDSGELFNRTTGRSEYKVLWNTRDRRVERDQLGDP